MQGGAEPSRRRREHTQQADDLLLALAGRTTLRLQLWVTRTRRDARSPIRICCTATSGTQHEPRRDARTVLSIAARPGGRLHRHHVQQRTYRTTHRRACLPAQPTRAHEPRRRADRRLNAARLPSTLQRKESHSSAPRSDNRAIVLVGQRIRAESPPDAARSATKQRCADSREGPNRPIGVARDSKRLSPRIKGALSDRFGPASDRECLFRYFRVKQ